MTTAVITVSPDAKLTEAMDLLLRERISGAPVVGDDGQLKGIVTEIDLVNMALGQFDLGPAAAFSIMYYLVILLISYVFYTVMTNLDKRDCV